MDIKKDIKKVTRKQLTIIISIAAGILLILGILLIWQPWNSKPDVEGTAYVMSVSECNTAKAVTAGNYYSGVVEAQKANEIKADTEKTIKEVLVNEGDSVSEGQELFSYDVEAMKLELEEGEIEIESMQNTISSNKNSISDLESQKKKAGSDAQVSYNTQIQALQAEINKTEYDIKVKQNALSKLESSISSATVTSPVSGTVKKLRTVQQMTDEGTDVIMSIVMGDSFRIKGKINEQNIGQLSQGDDVVICSRVDDTVTWHAMITEISQEPEQNNNMMMYDGGGSDSSSSSYAFYAEPDSTEGLRLGQHVVIARGAAGNAASKEGIWLAKDYLVEDEENGGYFVWAADDDGLLEKRSVETGKEDTDFGDIEIKSGLKNGDKIAYPSKNYEVGMETTDSVDKATVNGLTDDMDGMDEYIDEQLPEDGEMPEEDVPADGDFPMDGDIPADDANIPDGLDDTEGEAV